MEIKYVTPKSKGTATVTVAANNSSAGAKAIADYICDGTEDNVQIQAALDSLGSVGGKVHLASGTFNTAATVTLPSNSVLCGMGKSTIIKTNGFNDSIIENDDLDNGNDNIELRDLTIDGKLQNTDGATPYQIYFRNSRGILVTNITIDSATSGIFTTTFETDTFNSVGHGLSNNDRIRVTTESETNDLPNGIVVYKNYYVINSTEDTFKLSESEGGASVDLLDNGTGTHKWIKSTAGDGIKFGACQHCQISHISMNGGKHGIYVGDGNETVDCSAYITISDVVSKNTQVEHICLETGNQSYGYNHHITITNVTGHDAGQHGIYIDYTHHVTVSNCAIYNTVERGFRTNDNASDLTFTNCIFDGTLNTNASTFWLNDETDNVVISNCQFKNSQYMGIRVGGAENVAISNCYIENVVKHGMYLGGSNITVSDCIINNTTENAFFITRGVKITGCVCINIGEYCAMITSSGDNVTISNCQFKTIGVTTSRAIWCEGDNFICTNNLFTDYCNEAIIRLQSGTNAIIMGNIFQDPAGDWTDVYVDIQSGWTYAWITNNDFSGDATPTSDAGTNITIQDNMPYVP